MAHSSDSSPVEESFSLPLFLCTVAISLTGLVGLVKLLAPETVWLAQTSATVGGFAAAFAVITLLNCFMEYVFHRYVLHKPVVPFLSRFYKQHTLHHNLTRIGRRRTPGGREVPFVENIYPVTEPEQGEASFFPWYTLAVFGIVLTPLLVFLQWLTPTLPWFFAGYGALAASLMLYEIFHAIEHWPFERWGKLIEREHTGWFWRKVYSFHLRHHAVIDCNEAISGFFTLPVFDWVFGTFLLPKSLYVDGQEWRAEDFKSPQPCALIRWCDAKSDEIVRNRRARASATEPEPYTRGERVTHYLTHGVGLAASLVAFTLLVAFAAVRGNTWHVASCVVFGAALVFWYAALVNFRQTRTAPGEKRFNDYHHAGAFLLIGGTATPFLLLSVGGAWGWTLLAVVWTLCLAGGLVRLCSRGSLQQVSRWAYGLLGVVALIAARPLLETVPVGALWLLLAGAVCYVVGTVFHVWERVRYHQLARHAFAISGTVCHLLAVLLFVLPR